MDDDSGESLEPMGEVPLILLGESEQSVIHREDDVDG